MKSQKQILEEITELELLEYADKYTSAAEIITKQFKFASSGSNGSIITQRMKEWDIKWGLPSKNTKYKIIIKKCPVCKKEFKTKNDSKEKTTCSYSCANTYFRSGKDNPNYKGTQYRTICFAHHKKECIICGENKIVEVHHLDENHENNEPNNLIPLCPTHHSYWHSKYKYLVENEVNKYVCSINDNG